MPAGKMCSEQNKIKSQKGKDNPEYLFVHDITGTRVTGS